MGQEISLPRLDDIVNSVERFLAEPPYHACLLLVHPEIRVLSAITDYLVGDRAWSMISVGATLANRLLAVVPKRRPVEAVRTLVDAIQEFQPGPVICRGIELLFEPRLRLDPLRLLLDHSRETPLIVAWPGSYSGRFLAYAVPEHAHYRVWTEPDLCDYCVVAL